MKKILSLLVLFFIMINAVAQEEEEADTLGWFFEGVGTLNFSQISLYQWTAGGEPSVSGAALLNLGINYYSETMSWENTLDLGYGLIRQGRDDEALTRKSNDRIEFNSQFNQIASNNWFYSGLINFRTQFTEGYNYPNDEDVISDFLAPAYLTLSAGMAYKPNDNFQVFISPLSGKFTFVTDDALSEAGAFGVDPGSTARAELGGFVKAIYKLEIMENVNLTTKLDMFSNYLENPQNIDVNFEILLGMKINDYLAATINVITVYDDDVDLLQSDDTMGPGIQVKQVFGLGLSYSF